MRLGTPLIIAVAAFGAPLTAVAQQRTAYTQIVKGDYRAAERRLTAERRIFPERPELMLNLAAVYNRTGRSADASALYDAVLAQPNVLMEIAVDRTAWSHDLASAALHRMPEVQLSAR